MSDKVKVKVVCEDCQGDNVTWIVPVTYKWNAEKQEREEVEDCDSDNISHYCLDCDWDCGVEEVEI